MKETMLSNTISVLAAAEPQRAALPIALLKQEDGYVVGIRRSGLTTVPWAVHLVRRDKSGRIVDHEGEGIEGNHGEPIVAYTCLASDDADVEAAIAEGERLKAEAAKPVLEGDLREHVLAARGIIYDYDETERLGFRRALLRLHRQLGDDVDGPRLPKDSSAFHAELTCIRQVLTEWVKGDIDDFQAMEAMRKA